MAIPESFLEDLRNQVSLTEYIASTGVKLKRSGKNAQAKCPFPDHDDKTPSFSVIEDESFCYCHGCGGGGSIFDYVMEVDNLSFPEAVKKVADYANLEVPNSASESDWQGAIRSILDKAVSVYQQNLSSEANPQAVSDLRKRNINSESVRRFALGVAKNDWSQIKNVFGGRQRAKLLADSGLCIFEEGSGQNKEKFYDRFRDGIVFPIRDEKGNTVTFAIRHADGRSPKYLNGPDSPVFKKKHVLYGLYEALQDNKRPASLNVVEGYTDVIKMAQHGLTNATAPMGTSFTSEHVKKLIRITNKITFAFDGDKAGYKAAERTLYTLLPFIDDHHTFKFSLLPEGEDPDSYLEKYGADKFRDQLEKSEPFSNFVFSVLFRNKNLKDREDVASIASEFSGILNQMPESHLKYDLAKRFEQYTAMPLQQSMSIKVTASDMSPSELLGISNKIRSLVAQHGKTSPSSVKVDIAANQFQAESAMQRFINQKSIIAQSLPATASIDEKIELMNKAMEHVIINTNLRVKDESGITLLQMLGDAFNEKIKTEADHRLKMMSITQLKGIMASNDMSSLVNLVSTEIKRIGALGKHIQKENPDNAQAINSTLSQFIKMVGQNTRYIDALGQFVPDSAYSHVYSKSVQHLKAELRALASSFPEQQSANAAMPTNQPGPR